jgi:hypothetical protein
MSEQPPSRYIQFLPTVYQRDGSEFLRAYLTVLETLLDHRPVSDDDVQGSTPLLIRRGLADVLDILPDLFYPRLSFLFPEDTDNLTPPLSGDQRLSADGKTGTKENTAALAALNDYFGLTDPRNQAIGVKWQSVVEAWLGELLQWQSEWVGLETDDGWTVDYLRNTLATILPLFRQRGTAAGLQALLQVMLDPHLTVADVSGSPPLSVGANTAIKTRYDPGDPVLGGVRPYAFIVYFKPATSDLTDPAVTRQVAAIKALVDREKPVHTTYTVLPQPVGT